MIAWRAIIDAGQGDRPLKGDLRFRCAKCGSRLTDHVTMSKGGIDVQPWRQGQTSWEKRRPVEGARPAAGK
jgi:hypothetical protein